MKFEFTPSKYPVSLGEYVENSNESNIVLKLMTVFIAIPCFILVEIVWFMDLIKNYFNFNTVIFTALSIGFIGFLLYKAFTKRYEKNIVKHYKKIFCDIDDVIYFCINEEYLIRKNNYGKLEFKLEDISKIAFLKNTIVISLYIRENVAFIPREVLGENLNEFIDSIIEKNPKLILEDCEGKRKKKKLINIIAFCLVTSIAISSAFFIGKHNYYKSYKKYNLVTQNQLEYNNQSEKYSYTNEKLGLKIDFPTNWNGNYGIEELEDIINVYYIPNGKEGPKTTHLFTLSQLLYFEGFENMREYPMGILNLMGPWRVYTPKSIGTIKENSSEWREYANMYENIKNLKIEDITLKHMFR